MDNGILGGVLGTPISPPAMRDKIVDQIFDPKSENAQSGKAVAEALNTKMDTFGDVIVKDLKDGTFNITLNLSNENTPIVRDLIIEGVYENLKMNGVTFIDIMNADVQTGQISSGSTITAEVGMFSLTPTTDKSAENMLTNKGYVDDSIGNIEHALDTVVGDIESALDSIIAIQEQLIGGAE